MEEVEEGGNSAWTQWMAVMNLDISGHPLMNPTKEKMNMLRRYLHISQCPLTLVTTCHEIRTKKKKRIFAILYSTVAASGPMPGYVSLHGREMTQPHPPSIYLPVIFSFPSPLGLDQSIPRGAILSVMQSHARRGSDAD
ncbi:unnamed protein product [Pleuronectes platessa]|uniref:Uncharacterized protein n=1 Tax=Pleuronectes platessa TaxID=8262 RepID=A0A9N7YGF4_PLEPL|nr:unnamed protein product [Pleuronectes platessa]